MQKINASLQAEIDKGEIDPRDLIDLYEFYDYDYIPGVNGFDPNDAIEKFAAEEITWNSNAYRRELKDRSDIVRNMGEKTNNVTLNFSNISRYMATFAQTTSIEGLFLVIRCVAPSVITDSLVLFVGKCEKPSDIDKGTFTLQARQDFGNINNTVPPYKFQADDPEGRLPSDPLFEGIPFNAVIGSVTFPQVVPSTGFFGRLFGRRDTIYKTQQWSSIDATPLGQVVPECFGRVQMSLIPIAWADKGSHIGFLMVACKGPIAGIDNIKTRNEGWSNPECNFTGAPPGIHLGDAGGTGTNIGNTCQGDIGAGLVFSHLAYIDGASLAPDPEAAVGREDGPVTVTAIIRGRIVPLPDGTGAYVIEGWTDNPVHIARFILTTPKWVNINPAFMQDDVLAQTAAVCDFPLIDNTNTQVITVAGPDISQAGATFRRYLPTGNLTPRHVLFNDLGDGSVVPELEDGPYVGVDPADPLPDPSDPTDPTFISQKPLRKRYTANFPITESVPAVDLLYKTLFPAGKLYMRVNKFGRYEIRSEQPSDSTRLRIATSVGATSIPILDVTPWKTGPDLLQGRILLGFGLTTSEVRTPSAAVFSTSGNSITLAASASGGVTATASGGTLTGGSTTVQASGTITIGGTPAAGNTVTATINGIAVSYTLDSIGTTGTTAAMLRHYINANQRLNKFIKAIWNAATPTVITIVCLHGALTVPALLKAHTIGINDPTSAPTVAAAGSGTLGAGTYKVAYADVTASGTTALTAIASVVLTAGQQINISSLPALTGVSRDFYMSEKPNSTNLRFITSRTNNSNFSLNALPDPGSAIPPSYNTTAEEMIRVAMSFATNSQDVFSAWVPNFAVLLNDVYLPTVANGHKYQVTTAGPTGSTEPAWPTGAGATVTSGSAVFTEIGSTVLQQAGLTRANISKGSYKWPLGSRQQSTNQIKGDFRDAKNDFALTPFTFNDRDHQAQVKKTYSEDMDLTAVDSVNQVARIGGWKLSKVREGDWFNALATGPNGLVLEEGDVICASDDSGGLINIVTRIEDLRIRPNHDVLINQARRYSTNMFSDDVGAHRIPLASTLRYVQTKDTLAQFIDSPPLRDGDWTTPGFYFAGTHDQSVEGDWRGWALWADFGDGYTLLSKGDVPATAGTASTTLGSVVDLEALDTVNDVTFTFKYEDPVPSLGTATEADLVANPYKNLLLVGNEYVQAATIVRAGASITASDLFRGRLNTQGSVSHGAGERVVYINGAQKLVRLNFDRIGTAYNYKVVTTNQDLADATPISFTWTGQIIRPLPPTDLKAVRDVSGDWHIKATSNAREGEEPNFNARIRRPSDGVIMRDMPVALGITQAVVFADSFGAIQISKNSLSTTTTSDFVEMGARTAQEFTEPGAYLEFTLPALNQFPGGSVRLALFHSADTSWNTPSAWTAGVYTFFMSPKNVTTGEWGMYAWDVGGESSGELLLTNASIGLGPIKIRLVFVGSELRIYKNWTNSGATPIAISKVPPGAHFPMKAVFYLVSGGGAFDNNDAARVVNAVVGGVSNPGTIYSLSQQILDNGSGMSTIDVEMWQLGRVDGFSVRKVFP